LPQTAVGPRERNLERALDKHRSIVRIRRRAGKSGDSFADIQYCPWCGKKLPQSVRNRWFEALQTMGLDPGDDRIPPEFEDERWLGNQGA